MCCRMCSFADSIDAVMTLLHILCLILAGLMGIHSKISTVGKVSVKVGTSVSIPCLYESRFKYHVKALCKGDKTQYRRCKYVVRTDKTDPTGTYLISDDKDQSIFTVTFNEIEKAPMYYWCAVDKLWDDKKKLQLSVTDESELYVANQNISALEGGSVTVVCHYKSEKIIRWCTWNGICVSENEGSIHSATVTLNRTVSNASIVTMSKLKVENSGWYWCDSTNFQMPVHLTVHKLTPTAPTTMIPSTSITGEYPTTTQNSTHSTSAELPIAPSTTSTINVTGGENELTTTAMIPSTTSTQYSTHPTSAEPPIAPSTTSTINVTGGENEVTTATMSPGTGGVSQPASNNLGPEVMIAMPIIIITLLFPAAFLGFHLIKHCKNKSVGPDVILGSETGNDPDVTYTTISHVAAQTKGSETGNDPDVTYSTIADVGAQNKGSETGNDPNVTYTTIARVAAQTKGSETGNDPDVTYMTISHAAAQTKQNDLPEEAVTYSSVVMPSAPQMTEPEDGIALYSMVQHHKHQ